MMFFNKKEVRRYNFIVGTHCLYSGLFTKNGWFDFSLAYELEKKRTKIAMNYKVPVKQIKISYTLRRE